MFALDLSCRDACGAAPGQAAPGASGHHFGAPAGCGTRGSGTRLGLAEVLAAPIIRALMAADGTDQAAVEAMMRRVAARLTSRNPAALGGCME